MPRYQTSYTRDGIDFSVIQRTGNVCLLVGSYQHTPDHRTYEVHILRMKQSHHKSADAGKLVLMSPSMEEWGKHGWTHLTLAAAQQQFDTLANQAGGIVYESTNMPPCECMAALEQAAEKEGYEIDLIESDGCWYHGYVAAN